MSKEQRTFEIVKTRFLAIDVTSYLKNCADMFKKRSNENIFYKRAKVESTVEQQVPVVVLKKSKVECNVKNPAPGIDKRRTKLILKYTSDQATTLKTKTEDVVAQ